MVERGKIKSSDFSDPTWSWEEDEEVWGDRPDPTLYLPREDQFGKDTRDHLEKLGFTVISTADTHYQVEPPAGLRPTWSTRLPSQLEIEDRHSALIIREETNYSGRECLRFFDQDSPTE